MRIAEKSINKYDKESEESLIKKLKKAEEQIKNGEVIDADVVFNELRRKYGY